MLIPPDAQMLLSMTKAALALPNHSSDNAIPTRMKAVRCNYNNIDHWKEAYTKLVERAQTDFAVKSYLMDRLE